MTRQEFQKLCAAPVLLDGATGSNLMAAGMPRGVCPELWILEHPDAIHQLQTAYVEAGSQIIYAPTFGGNRINLARYGLEERIRELDLTMMGYAKKSRPRTGPGGRGRDHHRTVYGAFGRPDL